MSYVPPNITSSPLSDSEKDKIAILLGYSKSNTEVYEATTDLNAQQILLVRGSLLEIDRIELLIKESLTQARAIKVEDIQINLNYREHLKGAAATEVNKIALTIRLPVMDNMYKSSDDLFNNIGGGNRSGLWGGVSVR